MSAVLIAIGVWWTSNTIAHHAIHRPPFRRRALNRLFATGLSALVGIPQAAWRDRHLAHHAGGPPRVRLTGELVIEIALVSAIWIAMAERAPIFLATVYLPGYAAGLMLCAVHGHFEHAGGTTSYYVRLYNLLLFNDGYHVEHHMFPSAHWRELPVRRIADARESAWPAPLRWIVSLPGIGRAREQRRGLERLESIVLRWPVLQRLVVRAHERAFRSLCPLSPTAASRVAIVGGGMFPRTAIVLRTLFPHARLTIIDANRAHLDIARRFLHGDVDYRHERFDGALSESFDLLVLPLSFSGSRERMYERPAAPLLIAHDWLWHPRGKSVVVSIALLKRINLVQALRQPDRGRSEQG